MNLFRLFRSLSFHDKLTMTREHLTSQIEMTKRALASNQRYLAECERELKACDAALESLNASKADDMDIDGMLVHIPPMPQPPGVPFVGA